MSQLETSREGVAFAAKPTDLRDAVLRGFRHIVITDHLDLTTLPLRETSICPDGCASPLPDIRDTVSIQGNCSEAGRDAAVAAMAGDLPGAPLLPMRGTQCLLLTYEDSLPIVSQYTWLDSLYMRFTYRTAAPNARAYQYATLAGITPLRHPATADRWSGQHYVTRSTFQGDGLGPTVGVWADQNTYIENCTFANLGGDGLVKAEDRCDDCSTSVAAANVSVTIVNSTFFDPIALPGSTYVRAWGKSRVSISGCEFAPTPQLDETPFYTADDSNIYADQTGIRLRFEDDGLEVGAPPLSALPTDLHPTERLLQRSEWFANITAELDQELPQQPAYTPPNTATPVEIAVPPAVATPPPASGDSGVQPAVIGGGVAAGVVLLCAIAVCCVLWLRRRRRQSGQEPGLKAMHLVGGMSYEADMTITGGTGGTDGISLPSGKITRGGSRGASTVQSRKSALLGSDSLTTASPVAPEYQGVSHVMPELPPGAALPEVLDFVHAQLDSIDPEQILQQQFKLVGRGHRRTGAQSVVAFATGAFSGQPYVFKFFLKRASFDKEMSLRDEVTLAQLLPIIRCVHDPTAPATHNMPIADRWGRTLPPCIVMARGESLVDWLQRASPDIFQAASVVAHVGACLRQIHGAGCVHGAVKPAHILLHPDQNRWALGDFDRAAAVGTVKPPDPVLPYAPPEVVAAAASGERGIVAEPAEDAWALGVVTFELLTGRNAFGDATVSEEEVTAQLLGTSSLPWEGQRLTDDTRHRLGIFADLVLGLLRRDPKQRLSMKDFCNGCYDIVASHTTTAPPT